MKKKSNLHFNPCTKIVLLFLCIVISSLLPSIEYELIFVSIIALFSVINKKIKFACGGILIYLVVFIVSVLTVKYGSNTVRSLLMPFLGLVHKVYPVCMLSTLILSTTKVGEFLSAMSYARISKKISEGAGHPWLGEARQYAPLRQQQDGPAVQRVQHLHPHRRSEERRVGKECRSRWSPYH